MGVQHLLPAATMLLSNPRVRSLVYWDNPRDSGIVCGSLLVCLLAVRYISLISVIGNLSLALVTATMSFRIYKSVLAAVNKNQEGHPFKAFLDVDILIPEAQLTSAVENAGARVNGLLAALKAIILIENIVESAKFALGMYLVSYLGKLMTGLTLSPSSGPASSPSQGSTRTTRPRLMRRLCLFCRSMRSWPARCLQPSPPPSPARRRSRTSSTPRTRTSSTRRTRESSNRKLLLFFN